MLHFQIVRMCAIGPDPKVLYQNAMQTSELHQTLFWTKNRTARRSESLSPFYSCKIPLFAGALNFLFSRMQFDDMINGLSHSLENRLQNGLQHSLQNQIQNSLQNSLGAKFNPETHRLHHSLQSSLQSANLQQVLHPHHHGAVHSTIPSTSIPNHLSQSLVPPPSSLPMPLPPGGVSQILPTLPHHPEPVSTHPVAQSAQSIASNQPIGGSGQSPVSVAAAVQSGVQKIASANQMPEVQDNSNQIGLPCQDCGKVFKAKRNLDQHRNDF